MSGGGENRRCWDFSRIACSCLFRDLEGKKERLLEKPVPIPICFIDDPMKKVTRYLVGERLNWSRQIEWWFYDGRDPTAFTASSRCWALGGGKKKEIFFRFFSSFFFFFLGTFHRTRIRIICLIAPDYRRLNEDPVTMEELTETMECKVAFKWEQL